MCLFFWGSASAQARVIDPCCTGSATAAQTGDATDVTVWAAASPEITRLRAVGSTLALIVIQATARSSTFGQLVQAIGKTDGIVYVEYGHCGHGVRACLPAITAAGANRIVRVRVDKNKADWDLMGSIAHELQHAVEVLGNPAVTSTRAMHFFYEREGRLIGNVFETAAAIRAGNDVRAEARRPPFSMQAR
jgi:hypothetical protein